jgi:hypothetical protein
VSRLARALTGTRVCYTRSPLTCRRCPVLWQLGWKHGMIRSLADGFPIEMFLPSYADFHFDDLERKKDHVEDIVVTDEEVKNMFPSS